MPSSYDGVATATQAPSVPPSPGVVPTLSIPDDGEDLDAASVSQMVKTLADFEAWLMNPRAKATAWADPITRYRSALLHTRALIDHLGFPGGRIVQWDEDWASYVGGWTGTFGPRRLGGAADIVAGAAKPFDATVLTQLGLVATSLAAADVASDLTALKADVHNAGVALQAALAAGMGAAATPGAHDNDSDSWLMKAVQSSGTSQVTVYDPTAGTPRYRFVLLDAGDTVGDHAMLYRRPQSLYSEELSFALEWEQYVGGVNMPGRNVYCGLCEPAVTPETANHFAVFKLGPTGTWRYVVRGAGAVVSGDTGVPAAAADATRMRIEFVGGGVADDGIRAVRWYINGALVGTMSADLPFTTALAGAHFSVWNTAGGSAGAVAMNVGPARFRSNIWQEDVI